MTDNVIQPAGIREVAVIGLGLMGSGIAELVARSGRRVVAIEINQGFLDQGMARLHASLDKAVTRGKLTDTAREEYSPGSGPPMTSRPEWRRRPGDRGHTGTNHRLGRPLTLIEVIPVFGKAGEIDHAEVRTTRRPVRCLQVHIFHPTKRTEWARRGNRIRSTQTRREPWGTYPDT